MDFPYIENPNNYVIDFHIVYAGVLVYLMVKRAGHVVGLDGLVSEWTGSRQTPMLRWLVA